MSTGDVIRVGDFVRIQPINSLKSKEFEEFIIKRIIAEEKQWRIKLSSTEDENIKEIIHSRQGIIIVGESTPRKITFLRKVVPSLTGIRDIDIIILMELDNVSLSNACMTSRYISDLCRNVIWEKKVENEYPGAEKFKSDNRTWRNYYESLFKTDPTSVLCRIDPKYSRDPSNYYFMSIDASERKDLDVIKYCGYHGNNPSDTAEKMAEHGYLDGLKYVKEKDPLFLTLEDDGESERTYFVMTAAASGGHIDILKWALETNPDIHLDENIMVRAATHAEEHGQLEALKWFHSLTPSIESDGEGLENLSSGGWDMFTWIVENYSKEKIYIDWSDVERALEENRVDMLDFIYLHKPQLFEDVESRWFPPTHLNMGKEAREWIQKFVSDG